MNSPTAAKHWTVAAAFEYSFGGVVLYQAGHEGGGRGVSDKTMLVNSSQILASGGLGKSGA